jgi:hypothetical protein
MAISESVARGVPIQDSGIGDIYVLANTDRKRGRASSSVCETDHGAWNTFFFLGDQIDFRNYAPSVF